MEICVGEDLSNRRIIHSDGRQWPKVIVHHDRGIATVHDNGEATPWTTGLEDALSSGLVTDADLAAIRMTTGKACCAAGACATACPGDCSPRTSSGPFK